MGRTYTAGTRQLTVEVDKGLRDRVDQRVKAEARTLRAVIERALAFYLDNVPVESAPSVPSPAQPKRGRPAGSKRAK